MAVVNECKEEMEYRVHIRQEKSENQRTEKLSVKKKERRKLW